MKITNFLLVLAFLFFITGCTKFTMGFNSKNFDYKALQDSEQKSAEKLLLLYDDEDLEIHCVDSSGCDHMHKFFKIGEITHQIACLYFKQYYENVNYFPKEDLEQLRVDFPIRIYPKIIDYEYTIDTKYLTFVKTIRLDLKMNIQVFDNQKKLIFEKEYQINDRRNESYSLTMNEYIYLERNLYSAIFEILDLAKKDIHQLLENASCK